MEIARKELESFAPSLQNCSVAVRCDEKWSAMKEIQDGIRWCKRCEEAVYQVVTIDELKRHIAKRHCVCVINTKDFEKAGPVSPRTDQVLLLGQVIRDEGDEGAEKKRWR